jgi:hypothetical protein
MSAITPGNIDILKATVPFSPREHNLASGQSSVRLTGWGSVANDLSGGGVPILPLAPRAGGHIIPA